MPFLEAPGTSHGGIQEAKVPERRTGPVEIQDSHREILHVPKKRPHGYVSGCPPRREPRPHQEPHASPGSYEVSQSFALDEVSFAPHQHDLQREDVL
jgi:hypothetical protein